MPGRKVTAVRLSWWAKNLEERKVALHELRFSRIGRRARLKGEVVALLPGGLPLSPSQGVAARPLPRPDGGHPHPKMLPFQAQPAPGEGQGGRPHPKMLPFQTQPGPGEGQGGRPHPKMLPFQAQPGPGEEEGRHAHAKMLPSGGRSGLTEREMERFRRDFRGLDVPWLEREFQAWVTERDQPQDYVAAFYGFMKRKQKEQNA